MPLKDPEARKAYRDAYYLAHREEDSRKRRALYAANPQKYLEISRKSSIKHRAKRQASNRARHLANKEQNIIRSKEYREKNKEELKRKRDEKYAANPEKFRERCRRYQNKHREELNAKKRAREAKNREAVNEKQRAWNHTHWDRVVTSARKYYMEHRAEHAANGAAYRARRSNAPINDFTAAQWREMQAVFDHRCAYCGKRAKGHLTKDHITPLIQGGSHTLSNIVPACSSCNSKKKTGPPLCPVQPLLL